MNWLEIAGAAALYIVGLVVACILAVAVFARLGNGKGADGILFVVYPVIAVLVIGAVVGAFLLGRISS